jgi:tRNA A-37 threonylcarbamoyl transferase component Bud32/membrane-associated phospholipid phosphatase
MPTIPSGQPEGGVVVMDGPGSEAEAARGIAPVLSTSPVGRRRRPSGEPPPLPRRIEPSTKVYAVLGAVAGTLAVGLTVRPVLAAVTAADLAVLRLLEDLRFDALSSLMRSLQALGSQWTVRLVAWATIAVLLGFRRFQHLAAYLLFVLGGSLVTSMLPFTIGRMRPADIEILGRWHGYSYPSEPVAELALVLAGITCTMVPKGRWRTRTAAGAGVLLGAVAAAQLYLGVDHPTDVFGALVLGWALPVVAFRLAVPEEVFPVSYRRGRRAHLDVGGRRGEAIVRALDHQLGLDVPSLEPFALEGSAGSTPLRLHTRDAEGGEGPLLFGKLYARNHLRSDRWYKLGRTVLYGRLEDEKPFSSVRRLVEYEDHMLRLLRDAGLPTPAPYGFVEITPEREYVIVMEFYPGASEVGTAPVDDATIDEGLGVVRRLWDAGVAHRDIKPSNVLVQDGRVRLIDVAFATVRPTPWRQAVDLANMMLTLALSSTPERVYQRALLLFAPDDIAEAFAASRSITVPSQLRALLRADGRDLLGAFRALAPERQPVPIQLWSVRRVGLSLAVLALAVFGVSLLTAYLQVAGLL